MLALPLHLGIKRIPQSVANEVETKHRQDDQHARRNPDEPIVRHDMHVGCRVDDAAPGSQRVFDAEAQEWIGDTGGRVIVREVEFEYPVEKEAE